MKFQQIFLLGIFFCTSWLWSRMSFSGNLLWELLKIWEMMMSFFVCFYCNEEDVLSFYYFCVKIKKSFLEDCLIFYERFSHIPSSLRLQNVLNLMQKIVTVFEDSNLKKDEKQNGGILVCHLESYFLKLFYFKLKFGRTEKLLRFYKVAKIFQF